MPYRRQVSVYGKWAPRRVSGVVSWVAPPSRRVRSQGIGRPEATPPSSRARVRGGAASAVTPCRERNASQPSASPSGRSPMGSTVAPRRRRTG
ncbi:hypothetical protein ACFQ3Z_20575 [Streptomyces nogalater]